MNDTIELTRDQALELEWLRRRQQGIGSSDSAVIYLGEVFKRDRVALYLDKVRALGPSDVLEGLANPAFVRGHRYEAQAVRAVIDAVRHGEGGGPRPAAPPRCSCGGTPQRIGFTTIRYGQHVLGVCSQLPAELLECACGIVHVRRAPAGKIPAAPDSGEAP